MATSTVDGDLVVRGALRPRSLVAPDGSIGNDAVSASSPLAIGKMDSRHVKNWGQVHGSAATAERRVIHVALNDGTVDGVRAGVVVACVGDSTISVDVRKNGTTILDSAILIDSGDAAYAKLDGDLVADPSYSAGDVFEAVVTVSAGTGTLPQGAFVSVEFNEEAG